MTEKKPSAEDPRSFADVLDARLSQLEEQYLDQGAGREPFTHVPTGDDRLDRLGLGELGVLNVIGAHTGDGKSTARKFLAWGAASAGHRVHEFSLEDPAQLVADRVIADAMDVDSVALRRLNLAPDAREVASLVGRLRAVRKSTREVASRITWSRARTTSAIFSELDAVRADLVLIDYAQMFDAEGDERSTERVIARLADGLNRWASDHWCSVVLFSQVRREVVERGRKWFENARFEASRAQRPLGIEAVQGFRPADGDLQWSTALGQRAKLVTFLFRPGKWARRLGLNHIQDNTMEWYLDKNSWGQDIQVVTMKFDGSRSRLT